MRAFEFINEAKNGKGKMDHHHAAPTQGAYRFRDDGTDRIYNLNQVMKAAAMADGTNTGPVTMDYESFAGKNNMAYPYTKVEHNMMKSAFATVGGSEATDLVRDHRSKEQDDTHKVSPIKPRKDYRKK